PTTTYQDGISAFPVLALDSSSSSVIGLVAIVYPAETFQGTLNTPHDTFRTIITLLIQFTRTQTRQILKTLQDMGKGQNPEFATGNCSLDLLVQHEMSDIAFRDHHALCAVQTHR